MLNFIKKYKRACIEFVIIVGLIALFATRSTVSEAGSADSPLGLISGQTYNNYRFLLRCDLPEDWTQMSEEERLELIGIAADSIGGEDMEKMVSRARTMYDLVASSPDDTLRTTITIEKATFMNRILFSEKTILDGSVNSMKQTLEHSGMTNVQTERGKKFFAEREREYLAISGESETGNIYMEIFYIKSGKYYCSITLASQGENQIGELEGMFSSPLTNP